MPLFAIYLNGEGIQVSFQSIIYIAIIPIDILAGIFVDQVLYLFQAKGFLKQFYKQIFSKTGCIYRLVVIQIVARCHKLSP